MASGSRKLPAFWFFPGDWLKDLQLAMASPASRGIWIDFIATAFEMRKRGVIRARISQFARLLRCSESQFRCFLDEAQEYGFASVSNAVSMVPNSVPVTENNGDDDAEVTVICRRLVRDEKARQCHANRQARYRAKRASDAEVTSPVTPVLSGSSSSFSSSKRNICSADTGFAQFWKLYPRKTGKVKAEKAWHKLKPDAALVQRLIADLKTRAWPADRQFIPYPSTYLNGQRWEDEPDNSAAAAQESMPSADEVLRSKGLLS